MGIFSPPSAQAPYLPPMPTPPAPAPTIVDKSVVDAAQRTQSRLAASGGMSSTILTSGQGVSGPANVQRKTLLGQ